MPRPAREDEVLSSARYARGLPQSLASLAASPPRAAAIVYAVCLALYLFAAPRELLTTHTSYNHFSLLARAWLDGRLDLGGPPPAYTQNNDFAAFDHKIYVSFPPFPAVLLLPFVALAGSPDSVRDGLVFLLLAPLGPALAFVALHRLSQTKLSPRTFLENVALALLLGLGTVLFSTAVQGTVWFAAHVIGLALLAGYVAASVRATYPVLAGLALGLALATRTTLVFAAPFFLFELYATHKDDDPRKIALAFARFAAPLAFIGALLAWHNRVRFGSAFEFGHNYLPEPQIKKWGLFSIHYLGRNLGAMLASTPFFGPGPAALGPTRFRISQHGLALWITSPFLVLALFPRARPPRARATYLGLVISSVLVAAPVLLYHNTGRVQFGYRFSNDFAVLLVALIAMGRRKLGYTFKALATWSLIVNLFGAMTFQRVASRRYYAYEHPQSVLFEPD
ncbi:MAG: hypothetical protein U0271_33250 [Polyangiaceae bacterium]